MIVMILSDGDRSLTEIKENFYVFGRRFGFFAALYIQRPGEDESFTRELKQELDTMINLGWIECRGGKYALTEQGYLKADEHLAYLSRAVQMAHNLVQPKTVSIVAVIVHLILSLIKLPAALFSGSIGLFNDAADTLLDGLSSLMVYFGIRFNKERAVNTILVIIMLLTGGWGFYEAVQRFFIPETPEVSWFTFISAALSALFCLGLGVYQRYVGLKSGNMALITQSIDSRNHVIVAGGVIAGLLASLLNFAILDTLVGIIVAGLILKSGVELGIDLFHLWSDEEKDLSRFEIGFSKRYQEFRKTQLRDWMLYLVIIKKAKTRDELLAEVTWALDFDQYPIIRELGWAGKGMSFKAGAECLAELFDRGWLSEADTLQVTRKGMAHLSGQSKNFRRRMRYILVE
jgi:Co/Zn/Cd efflux system component